jgi:hypothetical protein
MTKARTAARFIAGGLLAVAAAAHADCGWVLWNDEARVDYANRTETRLWHVIAAAPQKAECQTRLREEIDRVMRPDTRPKGVQFKAQGDAVQLTYPGSDRPWRKNEPDPDLSVCLSAGPHRPPDPGAR